MRKLPFTSGRFRAIIILALLIILIMWSSSFGWTGFSDKKLWDWLDLLSASAAAVILASILNTDLKNIQKQAKYDRKTTVGNHRAVALQDYINKISDLLLKENLRNSSKNDDVRIVAQALTLALLLSLDSARKRNVIQFIYDAGLINKDNTIINLEQCYLGKINLEEVQLRRAHLKDIRIEKSNLNGIRLREANLSEAKIKNSTFHKAHIVKTTCIGADFSYSSMNGATLKEAKFNGATLKHVDFTNANLSGTDFADANLRGAIISKKQLKSVHSLKGATMPDGSKHH